VTSPRLVGALEIGGTHVTAAVLVVGQRTIEPASVRRDDLQASGSRDELVRSIVTAAQRLAAPAVTRWGVATPGPFDYARGVSLIRGVAKLDALYGVDLRAELSSALALQPQDVLFLNDADAFLFGEWWAGAAQGHERAIGVTLGTGLGSAFLERGAIVETDPRVPRGGRLDLVPFRGAAVEETLSRRGLRTAYGGDDPDVVEIARRARDGERRAADVLRGFGRGLGEFLTPWLERFDPTCLVLGGSIARSWDLWSDDFAAACTSAARLYSCGVAEHLDAAPLLGAAYHAARG
jgi:predicted NBD/HSP70 family sugar kinase